MIDDVAASKWSENVIVPKEIRSKLTAAANDYLREHLRSAGIPFIETWLQTAAGGYMNNEFNLDDIHVNRSAAISLSVIRAVLIDDVGSCYNAAQYQLLAELALDRPRSNAGLVKGLGRERVCDNDTGIGGRLRGCPRPYVDGREPSPIPRTDWIGGKHRSGQPAAALAIPTDGCLQEVSRLLQSPRPSEIVHAGIEKEMTVVSFRPVRLSPASVQIVPDPIVPPSMTRRAILVLGGRASLFLRYANSTEEIVLSRIGLVVVFDPHRLTVRYDAVSFPFADIVELSLILRTPSQPWCVIWSGTNEWPCDPFHFSVRGMRSFPPCQEATRRTWKEFPGSNDP